VSIAQNVRKSHRVIIVVVVGIVIACAVIIVIVDNAVVDRMTNNGLDFSWCLNVVAVAVVVAVSIVVVVIVIVSLMPKIWLRYAVLFIRTNLGLHD
jgi:CBS domain containing-hemolysin-like protein